jgi:hypothetical protein
MATEVIKTNIEDSQDQNPVSIPVSPLDSTKFIKEAGKKRGTYKKRDKEKIKQEGWSITPKKETDEKILTPEEDEELKTVCYSDGIQMSIQAMYKKGLMAIIFLDFKFSKIDTKFLPEKPVSDSDARVWALSLTDYLIENNGAEKTLKYLRPLVLIGQPLIIVTQSHLVANADEAEKKIDTMIHNKENK